jgi:hypothetical protein
MNKLICWLFGHKWEKITPSYLKTRQYKNCKRKEIYAHMSYTVGWKWIKLIENE